MLFALLPGTGARPLQLHHRWPCSLYLSLYLSLLARCLSCLAEPDSIAPLALLSEREYILVHARLVPICSLLSLLFKLCTHPSYLRFSVVSTWLSIHACSRPENPAWFTGAPSVRTRFGESEVRAERAIARHKPLRRSTLDPRLRRHSRFSNGGNQLRSITSGPA